MASCFACFRICSSADEERDRRQRQALRELEDIQSKPLECGQKAIDATQPATSGKAVTTVDASPSSSVDLESLNGTPSVDAESSAGRPLPAHAVSSDRRSSRVTPLNEAPRPPTTSQSSLSSSPNANRRTASLNPSPAPSPRTSNHGVYSVAATAATAAGLAAASSSELSTPSPHTHRTAAASPGAGSESTATPRLLPPSFLMHSPHGAATSALVTPHSARTPAAAGDAAACCHESCGTPDGAGREAVPSPHGPMNGGRAPRSSPAAEPSPSPPPEQQRTSPQHPSPNACVEEGGGAHAPRLGLTTAKSAPVHGSPSVVGAGGSGHEAGQEAEGASVRRERRRRSEALARVEEEDAAEVERPAAAPAAQGGQLRLLTEEAFLATVSSAPALAEPAQAGARSAGVRSGVCLGGGPTGPRFAEVGWMVDGAAGAQEGVRERPQSAAGCSASEPVPSPSGSAHASRRVSEAAGLVAAVDNSMHTSATPPPAATVQPSNLQDAEPFPPPAQPAVSAARSPLQAAPHRSSPAQPPKHAWPAAAVAAARASRPASAMPLQQPSRSPAAAPRASGTPAAAQPQQLRPSPSSRQPVPSTGSPVAAGPTRRAPFAAAAASPAAAPVRSPAPGSAARSGAGAAAAGASPFVSMYGSAASGRLRSTPPPPHAFSMQASASTRLALQDVLSSRRSMNRGGGGGFSSSMSVSGLGGNIDFRPKWRF